MCQTLRMSQFVKNFERFRLVTFDITDTLLRFKYAPAVQYAKTASQLGVKDIDQQHLTECFRTEFKAMAKKHPNYGRCTPDMTWQQWWIVLVENIFKCVQPTIPPEQLRMLANTLLHLYRKRECWSHIEGGKELVERMRALGKHVGVISNFDPSLPKILREMNMDKCFDFVLTSYESGSQKPSTKIFEHALQRCNNIAAHEALHIGNMYELDYLGARNSGWCSLLVTKSASEAPAADATHVYSCVTDMLTALETKEICW